MSETASLYKSRSISSRIKRAFFWTYSLSVLLVLLAAWVALEDLEATTMEMDKQAEFEHFLNRHETEKIVNVQSATLTLTYLPANSSAEENLPIIFRGLPVPFEGEVDFLDREYLVIINQIPQGTYYFAKDLSLFTQREHLMMSALLALAVVVLLLGYGLSLFVSRMFSRPIQLLSRDILRISGSGETTPLPVNYKDAELNQISTSFNQYLAEIEQLIKRERSLIAMASHELRTPIAVILGATEVIERRQQLAANDQKTLQRIIASAQTMSANVQALLALVRRGRAETSTETCPMQAIIADVMAEIFELDPGLQQRLEFLPPPAEVLIPTNRTTTRMLLQNLINNALNHNAGKVTIELTTGYLAVRDEAKSTAPTPQEEGLARDSHDNTGLGLYIVTLICEQLHWKFSLTTSPNQQTIARVDFSQSLGPGTGRQ
ncbi:HAMP domain-containing histidine kinase [Pseudomaricurvus alcaniphilus]|uniref:sensor histidine kinase n=1 Tax=Pseudomaricurvus alcaniphilus TaxID=1166482 RepID=UPI00140D0E9F|nr:HAMP domain-containing sensor histidine kinase [Pseudomaricurvus alcaniphilus]NHN38508.1 HAMP domain-containing histidine kinase [Pseudomaricurvus alcaniphilus]